MTQTPPNVPAVPQGTPAILIKIVAAILGIAGPLFAWVDPGNHLPHGAIQACVILGFLVVAAAIFLTHVVLGAVHEYGWSMNAVTHIDSQTEAELKTLWPEFKDSYEQAKPALEQIPVVQSTIDTISADVAALKAKEQASGLDPAAVVSALEQATGMTFPRAGAPVDPAATTGQAS